MVITIILVIINILIWLWCEAMGGSTDSGVMINMGALFAPRLLESGEWWRLFSAMFLHFGFNHLISNMVSLSTIGSFLERRIGKIRFLCIYLVAGICGNVLSLWIYMSSGYYTVSAGASGAIFGLFGAILFLVISKNPLVKDIPLNRTVFGVALSLYSGFGVQGINFWAHAGGLAGGFITTIIVVKLIPMKERDIYYDSYPS